MRVKKLLCSILALAMVLSTMSFTAFATETTLSTAEEFYNAVKDAASGDVINLGANVSYDVWNSIWNKDGVTINGNNHTITVNAVDSGINGGGLFLNASNLTINDLTVVLPTETTGERERLAIMSGTLNNVTVIGGTHGVSAMGELTINKCTFEGQADWTVETEFYPTSLTITDSTFEDSAVILRSGNNTFTGNTIEKAGEGVNVLGDAVISGNDFGESTLGIDRGVEVTIEKNIINNVEFSTWLDGDYSEVTVENNTLSDNATGAFQENVDEEIVSVPVVAKVNGKSYYSLTEAFAGAVADEDGVVSYEIYGKATLDNTGWIYPRAKSGATTINFVGMTDDAEISITSTKAAIIATDGISDMVAINYKDLILSRPNGSWAGDYGHANNYFTTWMRGSADAVVTYTDCTFTNGSCNNQYGETVYTNCTFNNPTEYALWIYGGEVTVTGGTFEAAKGIQAYSEGNAEITTSISDSTFDIEKKPAIVSASKGTMTLENVDVTSCEYGLLETKGKDGNAANGLAEVTVDGAEPEYVASMNGILYTNYDYALSEAKGDTSKVEIPVAKIGNDYYTSLQDAVDAAEANDVIDLLGKVVDLPEVNSLKITKDLTLQNGTIDITNGTWNGNSIIEVCGGTADDFVVATFNNVDFVGDNYSSAYGVIYAYNNGKAVIDNCDFNLSNEKYSAGGVLKGNGVAQSAFDVTNSTFDLENPNRVIANATVNLAGVDVKAVVTDDTLVVGDMNNHAFRNLVGTVKNSKISVDGFETGIKNTDGNLIISDNSQITLTNSKVTDLVVGAGKKVEVSEDSKLYADTTDIASDATVEGEGFIAKADAVYVQYKKTDIDADDNDTLEGADKYEIVLAGANAEKINELASADLTFNFNGAPVTNGAMDYSVVPAEGVSLTQLGDRFMFNYDGVTKYEESGTAIVIGTITVEGYGSYTLATAESDYNAVYATEIRDNIVDGFEDAATLVINSDMTADDDMVGNIDDGVIAVPTRELTINIDFPNAVNANAAAYQDMKVEITGNIDGVNKTVTYELGEGMVDGAYVVTEDKLVLNNAYTVTVSGAGYRTARYTVTMTDDKQLNFWNNVMDEAQVVEIGKDSSVAKVTFLAGDIVKDNNINIYDLSAVVSYFGTETDTTAYDAYAKYDLNRDGVIDSKDVAYVLVSWNN